MGPRATDRKDTFRLWTWSQSPACDASQPSGRLVRDAVADQYGAPSLCAIRRWPSTVTTARSSSG